MTFLTLNKPTARHHKWISLFIGAVLGVLLGFTLAHGPYNPPIPEEPPNESNRVHNSQGFSIVLPSHWNVYVDNAGPQPDIQGTPRSRIPSRTIVGVYLCKLGPNEPDRTRGFRDTVFQEEPARERQAVEQVSYEHGPQFVYELVFQRKGSWYRLMYHHPAAIPHLPEMVRRYLLTFKIAEPAPE